jgi:heme O synthase-like polyprenyltransferase
MLRVVLVLQMPHFLALAWLCKDDYRRGGFRMLPSVDPTGRRTAAVALRHIAFLLPLGAIAAALQVGARNCSCKNCVTYLSNSLLLHMPGFSAADDVKTSQG